MVSELSKYSYVIEHLPFHVAEQVQDLILNVPQSEPYRTLKEGVLKRCGHSEKAKLHELFNGVSLAGRPPSQLLRYMRALLGSKRMDDDILKQLWMDKLSRNAVSILVSIDDRPLDELADIADKIVESQQPTDSVVAQMSTTQSTPTDVHTMLQQITANLAALTSNQNQYKNRSHRQRSPSRPYPRSADTTHGMCWYHSNFGEKARKCVAPCSFHLKVRAGQ